MPIDPVAAKRLLENAKRDLAAARASLETGFPDWGLAIAYNAMLNAGMALLAARGYRAMSETHHATVVRFCAAALPADAAPLVKLFNNYRIRRHEVVYAEARSVGRDEARRAIENAGRFVAALEPLTDLSRT